MPRKPPPPRRTDEVSFSWPGQRRRPDAGILDVRPTERAQRQAQSQEAEGRAQRDAVPSPPAAPSQAPSPGRAQPPATRSQSSASSARERWIVTELRRQAVTTESALRDMSERVDQLGRTLRQIVDYLPRLGARPSTGAGAGAIESGVGRRLDELEARLEARLDELAGAAVSRPVATVSGGTAAAVVDTGALRAQVREELTTITKQLGELGQHLRAELVTASTQAEARLNRDRDQLRDVLNQTMTKLNELVGGTVSRDDLRQYWVEMAARLAKQQESVEAEREQLRLDLAERMDQIGAERELLRKEVGERLARVAEAAAVRDRGAASDTKASAAAAAQKAAIDELRRELHQLGAQLLAATNPKNRPAPAAPAIDGATIETLKQSMAQAAAAFSSAASKNDIEALRNQLAGTVKRLERAFGSRLEQDQRTWEEYLATALEAVQLTVEGTELNRRALLADVSAAVRAALGGVLPPLPTS